MKIESLSIKFWRCFASLRINFKRISLRFSIQNRFDILLIKWFKLNKTGIIVRFVLNLYFYIYCLITFEPPKRPLHFASPQSYFSVNNFLVIILFKFSKLGVSLKYFFRTQIQELSFKPKIFFKVSWILFYLSKLRTISTKKSFNFTEGHV